MEFYQQTETGEEMISRAVKERRILRRFAFSSGLSLLVYFAVESVIALTIYYPFERAFKDYFGEYIDGGQLAEMLMYVLPMAAAIAAAVLCSRVPFGELFPFRCIRKKTARYAAFIAAGLSVLANFAASLAESLTQWVGIPYLDQTQLPSGAADIAIYLVYTALMPAIIEELLFRGAIMQPLRRFGDGFAILASSVLFGITHIYYPTIVFAFILGLSIGYFTVYTGSLHTGMLMHFVNNFTASAANLFINSMSDGSAQIFTMGLYTVEIIIGVWAVIRFAKASPAPFTLKPYKAVLEQKTCRRAFFAHPLLIVFYLAVTVTMLMMAL